MNVMPTLFGTGLSPKKDTLIQTGATITKAAAGTPFRFRYSNEIRVSVFVANAFSVPIQFENFQLKPAMEFARCCAANRPLADSSRRTNDIGKVVSCESPHCIRHPW